MATWCEYKGLENSARFMNKHAEEELGHMNRVKEYALKRNCLPITPKIKQQQTEYKDLVDILNKSYTHERKVSSTYEEFARLALNENDYTTFTWLQWFLKEQVEEEDLFRNKLDKIEALVEQGLGILELDSEIGGSNDTCEALC